MEQGHEPSASAFVVGHRLNSLRPISLQIQAGRWVGGNIVAGLAGVDAWLESNGILSKLDTPETQREEEERDPHDALSTQVATTPMDPRSV